MDARELSADFLAETGRVNYVTPTSYLELITRFTDLIQVKTKEVEAAKKRYEVGLEKIDFTGKQVAVM